MRIFAEINWGEALMDRRLERDATMVTRLAAAGAMRLGSFRAHFTEHQPSNRSPGLPN